MRQDELHNYLLRAVRQINGNGKFSNGWDFKKTQKEALEALEKHLSLENNSIEDALMGYFEMPTGTGKTAVFIEIIAQAYELAQKDGRELRSFIVVPTKILLNDTHDSDFKEAAPHLKDKIGLYGDSKKQLEQPITIITYDSFVILVQNGDLTPDDVDLLISDEGHRGLSENRVNNIFDPFKQGRTAMLGFTATARFDTEKTIEKTHKNKIYERSLPDAVRDDELAAYISSQYFVIRAEPKEDWELREIFNEAAIESGYYKRVLKQEAWNGFALKLYREGRDNITGDLFTDNQAAFFTDDTKHADRLEAMLNSDVTLKQRAAAQGYEGVAVAIHSNLKNSNLEKDIINTRMQDYKAGKYMAVIGDSMFKEGFNYPAMKTIFDYQRGSQLDKAQILGRGARKFENIKKQRFEGLTFIDPIVYYGDFDPKIDLALKNKAIRKAITVKNILEGASVLSSSVKGLVEPKNADLGADVDNSTKDHAIEDTTNTKFGIHNSDADNATKEDTTNDNDIPNGTVILLPPDTEQPSQPTAIQKPENIFYGDANVDAYITDEDIYELFSTQAALIAQSEKEPLTIEDILESARATLEATGRRPTVNDGLIEYDPLANGWDTWVMINTALTRGLRGLPGGSSLSQLLDEHGIGVEELSIEDIVESARATLKATGRRPTAYDGLIEYGPLANGKNTWGIVNFCLSNEGRRGLSGGSSLAQTLDEHKIGVQDNTLLIQDILESARATLKETGKRPSQNDGLIKYGPLANGSDTWKAVNDSLTFGYRGLLGGSSLSQLLDEHGVGVEDSTLSIEDILESARATLKKTGSRPTSYDRLIEYGPLANGFNTWTAVDACLRVGLRGLPGGSSLSQLLDAHGIGVKDKTLSIDDILESARAMLEATGRRPSINDGLIKFGPLANGINTWKAIDSALRVGTRGLLGGISLSQLLDEHKIPKTRPQLSQTPTPGGMG